jgi:hypothetical protein
MLLIRAGNNEALDAAETELNGRALFPVKTCAICGEGGMACRSRL